MKIFILKIEKMYFLIFNKIEILKTLFLLDILFIPNVLFYIYISKSSKKKETFYQIKFGLLFDCNAIKTTHFSVAL